MKIKETIRRDGLRIISGRTPSKRAFLAIISRGGSAYDPPDKSGLFHYFEHMAFKGTKTRTAQEILAFAEKNLLDYNASTGPLDVHYYGTSTARKFPRFIEFLTDVYFNATYPQTEIDSEKSVVQNEIALDNDDDVFTACQALFERLWKKNPMRFPIIGTPDSVRAIKRNDLIRMHRKWHIPPLTTIIALGNVRHDQLVAAIEARVPHSVEHAAFRTWSDEYDALPSESRVTIPRTEREHVVVLYGCKFPRMTDERDQLTADLLSYLLTESRMTGLWNEIREKRGLAYALSGGIATDEPSLGSYFYAHIETLPEQTELVCAVTQDVIHRLPISDSAFEHAKEWFLDQCSLGCENLNEWFDLILHHIVQQIPVKRCERFFARQKTLLKSITLDDVEKLRARTFAPERFVTVIVQPS